ncbi:hypothetical protein [Corynebacterium tapiri]|uniref:hypothetical protein n=1 Tax=Corynebacterium tapiri TaxID=1448266 RepID=UPI0015D57BDC|nr:hypothetical protein [Corynebacterium tapiri]
MKKIARLGVIAAATAAAVVNPVANATETTTQESGFGFYRAAADIYGCEIQKNVWCR